MNKKQKESLIEYMMKYCGMSYRNAMMRFEKWSSDRIKGRKIKRTLAENKKMTTGEMNTMVIYLYKKGYTNTWIAESIGINVSNVSTIINKYRKEMLNEK